MLLIDPTAAADSSRGRPTFRVVPKSDPPPSISALEQRVQEGINPALRFSVDSQYLRMHALDLGVISVNDDGEISINEGGQWMTRGLATQPVLRQFYNGNFPEGASDEDVFHHVLGQEHMPYLFASGDLASRIIKHTNDPFVFEGIIGRSFRHLNRLVADATKAKNPRDLFRFTASFSGQQNNMLAMREVAARDSWRTGVSLQALNYRVNLTPSDDQITEAMTKTIPRVTPGHSNERHTARGIQLQTQLQAEQVVEGLRRDLGVDIELRYEGNYIYAVDSSGNNLVPSGGALFEAVVLTGEKREILHPREYRARSEQELREMFKPKVGTDYLQHQRSLLSDTDLPVAYRCLTDFTPAELNTNKAIFNEGQFYNVGWNQPLGPDRLDGLSLYVYDRSVVGMVVGAVLEPIARLATRQLRFEAGRAAEDYGSKRRNAHTDLNLKLLRQELETTRAEAELDKTRQLAGLRQRLTQHGVHGLANLKQELGLEQSTPLLQGTAQNLYVLQTLARTTNESALVDYLSEVESRLKLPISSIEADAAIATKTLADELDLAMNGMSFAFSNATQAIGIEASIREELSDRIAQSPYAALVAQAFEPLTHYGEENPLIARIDRLIHEFQAEGKTYRFALQDMIQDTVDRLRSDTRLYGADQIHVDINVDPSLQLHANYADAARVLVYDVMNNSLRAVKSRESEEPAIEIVARRVGDEQLATFREQFPDRSDPVMYIQITDNGYGLNPDLAQRLTRDANSRSTASAASMKGEDGRRGLEPLRDLLEQFDGTYLARSVDPTNCVGAQITFYLGKDTANYVS